MDLKTSDLNQHISSQFNEELETLRTHVLKMAGLVERNLRTAVARWKPWTRASWFRLSKRAADQRL